MMKDDELLTAQLEYLAEHASELGLCECERCGMFKRGADMGIKGEICQSCYESLADATYEQMKEEQYK